MADSTAGKVTDDAAGYLARIDDLTAVGAFAPGFDPKVILGLSRIGPLLGQAFVFACASCGRKLRISFDAKLLQPDGLRARCSRCGYHNALTLSLEVKPV